MKILVANLGSTSFKFRLFEMESETELAKGSIDRIGLDQSRMQIEQNGERIDRQFQCPDHGSALEHCLEPLGLKDSDSGLDGIGFKAVHGGRISGVQRVDENVLDAMSEMAQLAPAHNPIYVRAMRALKDRFPNVPLVAAFETGFHQSIPQARKEYGIPAGWSRDFSLRKWGFHGASHRYISQRITMLSEQCSRTVIMHLGGSSSQCAVRDGKSVATTMGMSPQTGLPQSNRVGDFDVFALPMIMQRTQKSLDEILEVLASESGLLGISEVSGDIRDLQEAASQGNDSAQLALDVYVEETRRHFGGMMVALGGLDCLVFTGGTGENGTAIRAAICDSLNDFGIQLDPEKNQVASGESAIHAATARVEIWVVPTNEELVVARQTASCLQPN